jgi:outer membrane lipoprotein-sorting protein
MTLILTVIFMVAGWCLADNCKENFTACGKNQKAEPNLSVCQTPKADSIDSILKKLNDNTKQLKSYQGQIEYLVSQPLFDSQTLRKGALYYQKSKSKSELRIDFHILKQDDEKEQKHIEQYIFDGVWLTHIDYPNKQAKKYQQAEPNNPIDCFELVSRNFPIIGFGKTEDLEKDFQIELIEQKEPSKSIKLHLKVKPDSVYKDDYTSVDFWIDKKLFLPANIIAHSTEEELYEIRFIKPKVNKRIGKKVFEFRIPKEFGKPEIVPLKTNKG